MKINENEQEALRTLYEFDKDGTSDFNTFLEKWQRTKKTNFLIGKWQGRSVGIFPDGKTYKKPKVEAPPP